MRASASSASSAKATGTAVSPSRVASSSEAPQSANTATAPRRIASAPNVAPPLRAPDTARGRAPPRGGGGGGGGPQPPPRAARGLPGPQPRGSAALTAQAQPS